MSGISPFTWMLFAWGAVTTVFVILMIYRSLVTMREDDQLFLDPAQTAMEVEQREIRNKISHLTPYTKGFGWASALLAVAIAGVWIYRGFTQFNAP
jgi:hypothetical protein